MAVGREESVYMAKLAEQAERYEGMVEYMQKVADAMGEGEELMVEESNLLFVAYENVIVAHHSSWRIVSSFMQKEGRGNHDHVAAICGYHARIKFELDSIYGGILCLLDARLIPVVTVVDSKVFYLKMKGDYYCYLAKFKTESEWNLRLDLSFG
ncbi:hypothetical protein BHE74_00041379 [Ensete ventricosum]|nr:hypothetical protein GW17_00050092 [Ensete ventricosum]RWW52207.1 hypothetical protein BHE74_00041379 [Ensete ventricosum]RZS06526.1 hypothetical protein BHM03_00037195 [Ensete ventricosum]